MLYHDPFKASFEFNRPTDGAPGTIIPYATGDIISDSVNTPTIFKLENLGTGSGANQPEIISVRNFCVTTNSTTDIARAADFQAAFQLILSPNEMDGLGDNKPLDLPFDQAKDVTFLSTLGSGVAGAAGELTVTEVPFVSGFKTFLTHDFLIDRYIQIPANQTFLFAALMLWNNVHLTAQRPFDDNAKFFVEITGVRIGPIN